MQTKKEPPGSYVNVLHMTYTYMQNANMVLPNNVYIISNQTLNMYTVNHSEYFHFKIVYGAKEGIRKVRRRLRQIWILGNDDCVYKKDE